MATAKKTSATKTSASVPDAPAPTFKPKKSVALSGVTAGNTALCTVGRSGNDLHYRGYDVLDFADSSEFEEIAHLLIHGKLPNKAELSAYKEKLCSLRGLPAQLQTVLESLPAFIPFSHVVKADDSKWLSDEARAVAAACARACVCGYVCVRA